MIWNDFLLRKQSTYPLKAVDVGFGMIHRLMSVVDEYLATLSESERAEFERLREVVLARSAHEREPGGSGSPHRVSTGSKQSRPK